MTWFEVERSVGLTSRRKPPTDAAMILYVKQTHTLFTRTPAWVGLLSYFLSPETMISQHLY